MGKDAIMIEIDAAIRAWNPKRTGVSGRLLPFNPIQLNRDMTGRLRETARPLGWKLTRAAINGGGDAFRTPGWFRKAEYVQRIDLP
jgi:hypothetical protein